jgi:hypothetical protein
MRLALGLSLPLLAGLGGCGRRSGLYADRPAPLAAQAASPQAPPRFIGRWAASAAGCGDPWVLEARGLSSGAANCEFDKVEPSPAGYAIVGACRSPSGPRPTRFVVTTPNQPQVSLLTISGGPFKEAAALQRCLGP